MSTLCTYTREVHYNWWLCNAISVATIVLWHVCWKPELWNQHRQPLLGNGSVNTPVPRQWLSSCHMISATDTHAIMEDFLHDPCRGCITRTSCHYERDNIGGLSLAVVKPTTIQETKLPFWHEIRRIDMISFAKPVLKENFYIVQKEEFSMICYMCESYNWRKVKRIHKRQTHPLFREDVSQGL
jgi:hypothetical protein